MSNLPEINPQVLISKLSAKNTDLTFQNVQLEALAEALRDERDKFEAERNEISAQLEQLKAASSEPVQKITEL